MVSGKRNIIMVSKKLTTEERFSDQSRRIRMLEEVFVPMAKTAMEMLTGRNGQPGMAEDMRNIRADVEQLIAAYEKDQEEALRIRKSAFERIEVLEDGQKSAQISQSSEKEIRLLGIKTTSEMKIAIINGVFVFLSGLVAFIASR